MKITGTWITLLTDVIFMILLVALIVKHQHTPDFESKIQSLSRTSAKLGYNAGKKGLTEKQLNKLLDDSFIEASN